MKIKERYKVLVLTVLFGVVIFPSCLSSRLSNKPEIPTLQDSKEFDKYLNHGISIYGLASNAKIGAIMELSDSIVVWINGLQNWSQKYYSKHIRVKGILTKEEYYPLVIEDTDSLVYHAGVTVFKSEFDGKPLYKYVLKDAVY